MGGAACAKIIRNGLRSLEIIDYIVEQAQEAREKGDYLPNQDEIVVLFNEIEDAANKADRAYLEGQGFKGPWPHALSFEEETK